MSDWWRVGIGSRWVLALGITLMAGSAGAREAGDWLRQMGQALRETNYQGVLVYSRGDDVSSLRIAHRYRHGEIRERLVLQDGQKAEIRRRNGRVVCDFPVDGRIHLDALLPSVPFRSVDDDHVSRIQRWYQTSLDGQARIAGHESVVLGLTPKDQHRLGYRLWLEKQSGLLVKSQVLSTSGEALERFQFTMLELTDDLPDALFESDRRDDVRRGPPPRNDRLPEPGLKGAWRLGWHPDGFRPARVPHGAPGEVAAFTDGLASFSVFIRQKPAVEMPLGASRVGATTIFMRRLEHDGERHLITVVGEIPPETAMKVARSVTFGEAPDIAGRP
ncbi:MucB/RseB-like sigma(E) regulatory protein [Tamilnaduibacter salinus]|nr:MucB/RseB C-terminal domain-containing protein [Tamilnaduibacter salinus]PVY78977.1 MucB/RseB-like sigma(E) regulatory protein [Tamilnaduibacter salinus]